MEVPDVDGLSDWLREKMAGRPEGWISFAEWMDAALYHPRWGYYMRPAKKIGKDGDFYTSSSFAPLFGALLAEALGGLLRTLPSERWNVLELGGGDGRVAAAVLDAFRRQEALYGRLTYYMVEKSPYHRQVQQGILARHQDRVVYLEDVESLRPFTGVVFSNEFFDALPVHVLLVRDGRWHEAGVMWSEADRRFVEKTLPCRDRHLLAALEELGGKTDGEGRMEFSQAAVSWMERLAGMLESGYVLTVDYGYVSDDGRCRPDGTLRGYRAHQLMVDVLVDPGEQDLTADVNFTFLVRAGEKAGLRPVLLERQRDFLLRLGILEELVDGVRDPFSPEARKNRAIRQLLFDETGMGSRFFVLLQAKNVAFPPRLHGLNRTFHLDKALGT